MVIRGEANNCANFRSLAYYFVVSAALTILVIHQYFTYDKGENNW